MTSAQVGYTANEVRTWQMALIAHPGLRGRLPIEAGVSFPALSVDSRSDLRLDAFHYVVMRDELGRPAQYATFSRVQVRASDLALLDFATFDQRVLFPNLPLNAPYTAQAIGFLELRERSQLKAQVQALLARLATAVVNEQRAGEDGATFLRQYSRLLPPSLIVYYRTLNPAFFDWLRG